ncbi:ATP-binding protein [Rhodococcus sp. NPDC054953]
MTRPGAVVPRYPVEVRVRADLGELPVLRAMAETVALLGGFTLDDAADVKLAVDEVCSALIGDALPGADLSCRLHSTAGALRVRAWTDTASNRHPDERGFVWHVLRALTDAIDVTREPLAEGGFRTRVEFVRSRGGDA